MQKETYFYALVIAPYGLSVPTNVRIRYVTQSYAECLGAYIREIAFNGMPLKHVKYARIVRFNLHTLTGYLRRIAELEADCYNEDYSMDYRDDFADRLYRRLVETLYEDGRLDFLTNPSGVKL